VISNGCERELKKEKYHGLQIVKVLLLGRAKEEEE
jgi:hypothetical protein